MSAAVPPPVGGIGEGLPVPLQRETLPIHGIASGIEGESDDKGDRRIEEEIDEGCVEAHDQTSATRLVPDFPSTKRM